MVQLMTPRKVTVKLDVDEESSDSRLAPIPKRAKLDSSSPPQVLILILKLCDCHLRSVSGFES